MDGKLSTRRQRWSALALVVLVVGCFLVAVAASVKGSPFSPLPSGTSRFGPIPQTLRALHLADLPAVGRLVLSFGALGLVAVGFLLVLWETWHGRFSTKVLVGVVVVLHALAIAMPPFGMHDIYLYALYGRLVSVHHANPYLVTPGNFPGDPLLGLVDRTWASVPTLNGPVLVSLFSSVTRLVKSLSGIVLTFKLLAAASSLGTVFLLHRLATRLRPARVQFAVALFGLNPLVIFTGVASGHSDCLIALALVSASLLIVQANTSLDHRGSLELAATALLAVAALMKVAVAFPLLLAVSVAILRRSRGSRLRVLAGHVTVVTMVWLIFASPYFQWHDPTLGATRVARWGSYLAPTSFWRLLATSLGESLGLGQAARGALWTLIGDLFLAAFVAGFAMIMLRLRRPASPFDETSIGASWAWVLLLLILAAPALFPWYLLWVLPFAWLLPLRLRWGVIGLGMATFLVQAVTDQQGYPAAYQAFILIGLVAVAPAGFALLLSAGRDLILRILNGRPLEDEGLIAERELSTVSLRE